jgi:hypothetical protein
MSQRQAFVSNLGRWLEEGPDAAPPDLIDVVLADVAGVKQRGPVGAWRRGTWRAWPASLRLLLVAALTAVAVIASMTWSLGRGPSVVVPPSASSPMTASPSPHVSPTPIGSLAFQPCTPTTILEPAGNSFDPGKLQGRITYRVDARVLAIDPVNSTAPIELSASIPSDPRSWSADGTRLALIGGPQWMPHRQAVILSPDGSVMRVADNGDPSLSPDGRIVVYAVTSGGLCLVNTDGSSPRLLKYDPSEPFDEFAAWSPDGSRIAWLDFVEDHPIFGHHAYGLSFIDPDGSNYEPVVLSLPGEQVHGGLVWSPDGSRLAFWMTSGVQLAPAQIYVVDADGTDLRQITTEGDNRWPSWSPDGSRIAFVHDGNLYTMTPDDGEMRPVPGVRPWGSIAWNPVP